MDSRLKRIVNVAVNRPASQSSTSRWSQPDDARRAVSSARTADGSFAFCTEIEVEPFWLLDLQSCFPIRRIVIFNREDSDAGRACPLVIDISTTGHTWRELCTVQYVFGGAITRTPLDLQFKEPIEARYIRLRRTGEPRHFHLDKVEIYSSADDIKSCAQLAQDLWVMRMTGGRSGGKFVEIGSTNGVDINNTYLLETRFGWRGACVEPNPIYYEQLARNRAAKTFRAAVFRESGRRLEFVPHGEFGTLVGFESSDSHAGGREAFLAEKGTIHVETISASDLLEESELPSLIDYLSIDTEGSEWDILSAMDFSRYGFALITIEHNFVHEKRRLIFNALKSMGYYRLNAQFDDWYYNPVYLSILNGGINVDYRYIINEFVDKYKYGGDEE